MQSFRLQNGALSDVRNFPIGREENLCPNGEIEDESMDQEPTPPDFWGMHGFVKDAAYSVESVEVNEDADVIKVSWKKYF